MGGGRLQPFLASPRLARQKSLYVVQGFKQGDEAVSASGHLLEHGEDCPAAGPFFMPAINGMIAHAWHI